MIFLYLYSNKINLHFIEGTFSEGLPLVNEVLNRLNQHINQIDEHHIMMFYYKIASLYFGNGDFNNSIHYLSKIINNKSLHMREDLMCFSRILNLVAHYEAGLDYQLDSLIKSTYKFLIKMEDLYAVQKEMILFLKSLGIFSQMKLSQHSENYTRSFRLMKTILMKGVHFYTWILYRGLRAK